MHKHILSFQGAYFSRTFTEQSKNVLEFSKNKLISHGLLEW